MRSGTVWKVLLGVGCIYEAVALATPLPTVTKIVRTGLRVRATRPITMCAIGYAIAHFME